MLEEEVGGSLKEEKPLPALVWHGPAAEAVRGPDARPCPARHATDVSSCQPRYDGDGVPQPWLTPTHAVRPCGVGLCSNMLEASQVGLTTHDMSSASRTDMRPYHECCRLSISGSALVPYQGSSRGKSPRVHTHR